MNSKKELTELTTIIMEVFDDPARYEIAADDTAEVLMDKGYRREDHVAAEILEEIENYLIDECFITDPTVADIYDKVRAMRKRYIPPTPVEEAISGLRALQEKMEVNDDET